MPLETISRRISPATRPGRAMRLHAAFTLIELLVVVAILVLLLAIVLPSLSYSREWSRATVCASNQRQLGLAFLEFANDHSGYFPGSFFDPKGTNTGGNPGWPADADAFKRDWLYGDNPTWSNPPSSIPANTPMNGTIYPYVNNPKVYRCPSYFVAAPLNSGAGSNGVFDYSAFAAFAGAKFTTIQMKARFHYSTPPAMNNYNPAALLPSFDYNVMTPLLCEEEVQGGLNGGNLEGEHCTYDRLGHQHFGGANYVAVDGSVHCYVEPLNQGCWNWEVIAPSGQWKTLGNNSWTNNGHLQVWGYWATQ